MERVLFLGSDTVVYPSAWGSFLLGARGDVPSYVPRGLEL